MDEPFLRKVTFKVQPPDRTVYPFAIPAVAALDGLTFGQVTFFVGENGSGKSTILEAIAVAAGFNAEGGTSNFRFASRPSESPLHEVLRVVRSPFRPRTGFFLRAESFFNLATHIEELDRHGSFGPPIIDSYGGRSLHEQSHGESFLALLVHRFGERGLYILDEPEAALSPSRQLALLARMHTLVDEGSQFIVATHSPIVLAYPGALIYRLDADGITKARYDDLEHVTLTRDFLNDRGPYLAKLR